MKRIISGILGLSVASTMAVGLTGCADVTETTNTLTWYTIGDKPADHDLVMEKANEIIEAELGVKLDMQYIDSASFTEKMKLKMASAEPYDLAFTGYVNNYQNAAKMNGLYDITELIEETGLNEVIPQYYLDTASINGRIYGIPNIQVISNPTDIEIPQSIAEECGIVEILAQIQELSGKDATYEDLQQVATLFDEMFEKVHTKRPDLITMNPNNNWFSNSVYEGVTSGSGAVIRRDGSSTEIVNLYETDEWKLGVQKKREWYQKGYIRNDIASKGDSISGVDERKQVAFNHGTWKPGQEQYVIRQYGEPNLHAKNFAPYVGRTSALATMISVGANSQNPKKAVELIKLVNTNKELYNLICWGIKDKHHTINEDGTVSEIPDSGYNGIGQNAWKYGNQFNGYVEKGQPADVWEQTEKMNNEADKSPMLGFVPDTSNIESEIANISNIEAEYKARKDFGTEDIDVWYDKFCQDLKAAGIDTVINELQEQYDAWLASK